MSELGAEETPKNVAIRLTDGQKKAMRLICVQRDVTIKEWVTEAFEDLVRRSEEGEEIQFYAVRKDGQPVTVQPPEDEPVRELRKLAEKSGVRFNAAYYTAVVEYLTRQREEVL